MFGIEQNFLFAIKDDFSCKFNTSLIT